MMGNHYLLNRPAGWAAVCISKNACTSLKKAVLEDEGIHLLGKGAIHDAIGYSAESPYLRPVASGKPPDLFSFAVWRDPIERFASTYRHFALDGHPGRLTRLPADPDAWIDAAEKELAKPVLEQDEHLRRQSDYYRAADVDAIVGIGDLSPWLEQRGGGWLPRQNKSCRAEPNFSPAQIERLRRIYADDWCLLAPTVRMRDEIPVIQGLWVGASLPPLAELTIRSFLDHGFRFRLATYGQVAGIPDGAEVIDAGGILPPAVIFTHPSGSLAPFADWFRYRLVADHGGIWTDLDMACLRPFRLADEPWFALADANTANIGLLNFPASHPVPSSLADLAEDPATLLPWDGEEDRRRKEALRARFHSPRERRMNVRWGDAGPWEFTRALKHHGIFRTAVPSHATYALPWNRWRHAYDGTRHLDDPGFKKSLAIHLWGEMLRREPDAMRKLAPGSLVATLMQRHGVQGPMSVPVTRPPRSRAAQPEILVGICSCLRHANRRQAVRETWLSKPAAGIRAVFFVGDGDGPLPNEPDTLAVPAPDTYEHLPEKVLAFFRASLARHDFEWLFKCDDDTYVALDRLRDLATDGHELAGNEFLNTRKSPSGGAGYLLSRAMVEALAADLTIPATGAEDILIGEAALRHGARPFATPRLCWDTSRYPRRDNDVITSHWCAPDRLRVIHAGLHEEPEKVEARHAFWQDRLQLFPSGLFTRTATRCAGNWQRLPSGEIRLRWFDWQEETLIPDERDADDSSVARYRCVAVP